MRLEDLIETMRELDENIDFARGVLQWKIILFLSEKGPSSTSEISKGVGANKKAVIDSVRKLIDKGLVNKVKYDIYQLSQEGRTLLGKLSEFSVGQGEKKRNSLNGTGTDSNDPIPQVQVNGELDIMRNLNHYYYFVEIGKAAMINGGKVPVSALARELGISKRTVLNYLDVLSTRYKFFKKINRRGLSGLRSEWMITDDGKKVLAKIPGMHKMRNNIFLKYILKTTFSTRLDYAIFKLLIIFSIVSPIIFIFYKYPLDHLIAAIWLYFLVFYALSSVMAYLSLRS
jgi:Mn-dependent DtxR family transcriptional regulator